MKRQKLTHIQPWGTALFLADSKADADSVIDRRESLGSLASLDDQYLLALMARLSGVDLARFSQCSSLAYIFARHEPTWKSLCMNKSRVLDFHVSWFHTFVFMETNKVVDVPPLMIRKTFYSDLLHKSRLCAEAKFDHSAWNSEFISESRLVDRIHVSQLTQEHFIKNYEEKSRPLIIEGAADAWPARAWTMESLSEMCGDLLFRVGSNRMTMRNFLQYASIAHDDDPLYLFDKNFASTAPFLAAQYSVPDVFKNCDLLMGLDDPRPDYRWLIAGAECAGSSFHIDPNATSAWNALLVGRKKWMMYPGNVIPPGVYPSANYGEVATPLAAVEWFIDFYEQASVHESGQLEVVQNPGDVVFVPSGWFHTVLNMELSVAVTQNYASPSRAKQVLDFFRDKPDQISGIPSAAQPALYGRFRDLLARTRPEILNEIEKPSVWETSTTGQSSFSLSGLFG